MKMMYKMISMLLVVAVLLGTGAAAVAENISMSDEITMTGISTASVTQAVRRYFEAREDYLLGNSTAMDWPVIGIVNDETVHMAQYTTKGIILQETSYAVEKVNCYDTYAEADAVETISYVKNGSLGTEEIVHKVTLYLNDTNIPVVAADSYAELCSNFESCSYLPLNTRAVTDTAEAGSSLCVIKIAEAEIGTVEGNNNDTKYGEWYGLNNNPWCAMFICWCADQANVSTTIIPKIAGTDSMLRWYRNENRYYRSAAYSGTYTPQAGDIIFIGDGIDDADHVGIVEKVADGKVWIIDGNNDNMVKYYSYRLTNSSIVGYGNPAYESNGHVFSEYEIDDNNHWQECSICGYLTESEQHTMGTSYCCDETYHWQVCTICDFAGMEYAHFLEDTYVVDGCNHLYECMICNNIISQPEHSMGTAYASDESYHWHECTICGCASEKTQHGIGNVFYYDATHHWKTCPSCGTVVGRIEHVLVLDTSGRYKCRFCDCTVFSQGEILKANENMEG